MRFPRIRFTIGHMMVAVAIVAVILVIELGVVRIAIQVLGNKPRGASYTVGEIMSAWAVLHVPLGVLGLVGGSISAVAFLMIKTTLQRYREARLKA